MSRARATAGLVALLVAAATLVVVELSQGALDAGRLAVRDPCAPRAPYPGQGLDAVVQRIVLDGLDGAACELATTREELVLSFAPGAEPIRWDDETVERAVRAGLLEAVEDAERRGSLNALVAALLHRLLERAPIQWLIDGGQGLLDLLS